MSSKQYLYVARCEGYSKIGISCRPASRVVEMQTANPLKLSLSVVVELGDRKEALLAEEHYHQKYSDRRVLGEWFDGDVTPDIVKHLQLGGFSSTEGSDGSVFLWREHDFLDKALAEKNKYIDELTQEVEHWREKVRRNWKSYIKTM